MKKGALPWFLAGLLAGYLARDYFVEQSPFELNTGLQPLQPGSFRLSPLGPPRY